MKAALRGSGLTMMLCVAACSASAPFVPAPLDPLPSDTSMEAATAPPGIYVSPNGSDRASGTFAFPLRTLAAARDHAAAEHARTQSAVTVYLRDGRYRQTEPVVFGPEHSGSESAPITFRNFPGETPRVSGAVHLTVKKSAWKKASLTPIAGEPIDVMTYDFRDDPEAGGALRAAIDRNRTQTRFNHNAAFTVTELFVANQRATRSRHPNVAFVADTSQLGDAVRLPQVGMADSIDLLPDPNEIRDGHTEAVFSKLWQQHRAVILPADQSGSLPSPYFFALSFDVSLDLGHVTGASWGPAYSDKGHFENHKRFVDSPGEWFLDEDNLVLYYYPIGDELSADVDLEFPLAYSLVELAGLKGALVHDLRFEGLTFQHTNWRYQNTARTHAFYGNNAWALDGVINGDYVDRITVADCEISHFGANGVCLGGFRDNAGAGNPGDGQATNIVVERSRFIDGGAGAVRLSDSWSADSNLQIVDNSRIEAMGRVFNDAAAIQLSQASTSLIARNNVTDVPYSGIAIGNGSECRFSRDDRHRIVDNTVDNTMTQMLDGGGIYVSTWQGEITGNKVTRTGTVRNADASGAAPEWLAKDIYLDDRGVYWNIAGNDITKLSHKDPEPFNYVQALPNDAPPFLDAGAGAHVNCAERDRNGEIHDLLPPTWWP